MNATRRTAVAAAVLVTLVASACSSSSVKVYTPAQLKPALLATSDLPSGYKPAKQSSDSSKITTTPAACGKAMDAFDKQTGTKDKVEQDFDSPDANALRPISVSLDSDKAVKTEWKTFKSILYGQCAGTVKISLGSGFTGTMARVPTSILKGRAVEMKVTLAGDVQGTQATGDGYFVFVLHGKSVVESVSLLSVSVPSAGASGGAVTAGQAAALAEKQDAKVASTLG